MDPIIVLVMLVVLITIGFPIFLALGLSGLVGLYMARGSLAFFFAPSSLFGQLNAFELIALPLLILMGNFLGATPVGSIAVPQMLQRGYSRSLAAGAVVSAGALAMLIPPSVPFIIYGAVSSVSVADLFIGGIVLALALGEA